MTASARRRWRPDANGPAVTGWPAFPRLWRPPPMVSPTAERALAGNLKKSSTTSPSVVHELVAKARVAQAEFEKFTQEQVDGIVRDFGKYVYDNAESIAAGAHKETGLG